MAVVFALGSFTITSGDTANIAPSLTWSDAGSHTPQAVLLFYRNGSNGSAATGRLNWGYGMFDGTTQWTVGGSAEDATSSTQAGQVSSSSGCLIESNPASGGAQSGLLAYSSFGTDAFTLSVSDAFATTSVCEYVAIAGYTNAKVMVHQEGTSAGNYDRTGAGFQPTTAIFMPHVSATIGAAAAIGGMGLGWATASAQANVEMRYRNAVTSDYIWSRINTSCVLSRLQNSATTPAEESQFVSFLSDGYRLNKTIGTGALYYGVLLLNGGASAVLSSAAQTGTGTFNVTATGITPTLVLGLASNLATATETNGTEGVNLTIGAHTSGAQWALTVVCYNAETLSGGSRSEDYSRSDADKFLLHHDRTGANTLGATGEITKSSFSNEQVTLNQTDADSAAVLLSLLVLGETYSAGSTSVPVLTNIYRQQRG